MKKKAHNKKFMEQIENLGILICITLLVMIVSNFYLSYHNVDLVYNANHIVNRINSVGFYSESNLTLVIPIEDVTDLGSDYQSRPLQEYYISGMNGLVTYFLLAIFDAMVLGFLLSRRL